MNRLTKPSSLNTNLSTGQACTVCHGTLSALDHLHTICKTVHRDIKVRDLFSEP